MPLSPGWRQESRHWERASVTGADSRLTTEWHGGGLNSIVPVAPGMPFAPSEGASEATAEYAGTSMETTAATRYFCNVRIKTSDLIPGLETMTNAGSGCSWLTLSVVQGPHFCEAGPGN